MPSQLPNPYGPASPIGNSLSELMKTMFDPTAGGIDPTRARYNRAAAAKAEAETGALLTKQRAMSGIGNMVADMVSGPTPEGPRPDPGFEGPMPAMDRAAYFRNRAPELMQSGLQAEINPTQLGRLVYSVAKQANLPDADALRYSADFIRPDEAVSLADREAVARRNAANAVTLEHAKPHNVAPGGTAYHAPGDPRFPTGHGPARGLPTLDTVKGAVLQRAADSGQGITPSDRSIMSAGGGQPTPRMYATPDGYQGVTYDGLTDARSGAPLPEQTRVGTISDTSESFSGPELAKRRATLIDARARTQTALDTMQEIDAKLAGADADQTIGIVGSTANALNSFLAQARAAGRFVGVPFDAPNISAAAEDTFRRLGIDNAEHKSAVTSLAYAIATAREPGRLTEQDITRALQEIGATQGDPIAMRHVLRTASGRLVREYQNQESAALGAYGDRLQLQPAQLRGFDAGGAGGASQQVPPPAQRIVGQVYQTPRGPAIWRGNGWELQ